MASSGCLPSSAVKNSAISACHADAKASRSARELFAKSRGVNLTKLRALAKRLKSQHELALELWATGDTAPRLLATLIAKPKLLLLRGVGIEKRGTVFSEWTLDVPWLALGAEVAHVDLSRRLDDWLAQSIDAPDLPVPITGEFIAITATW